MMQPENAVKLVFWTNTLKHLQAKALKKQENQHHSMRARNIQDKLTARRGKREVILQRGSHFRPNSGKSLLKYCSKRCKATKTKLRSLNLN